MKKLRNIPLYVFIACLGIAAAVSANLVYKYQELDTYQLQTIAPGPVAEALSAGSNYANRFVSNDVATERSELDTFVFSTLEFSAAGWPFKFYFRRDFKEGPPLVLRDLTSLLLNFLFFATVIALYVGYERFFARSNSSAGKETGKMAQRRIGLLDLMLLTALFAAGFGYWRWIGTQGAADKQLSDELGKVGGLFVRSALAPGWMGRYASQSSREDLFRLTEVNLHKPSSDLVAKVVKLETIQKLKITGDTYDLRLLDQLATKPLLSSLAVVGRTLDARAVAAIGSCKSLESLSLMRTNINAKGLTAMGEMPRLRELNLVHTEVDLEEFSRSQLSKTLQVLMLPHGNAASQTEMRIENWPKLRILRCFEHDAAKNNAAVALVVRDCPGLQEINLDVLRKFDLTLANLPMLEKVSGRSLQVQSRLKDGEFPPSFPSLGAIDFKSIPKLIRVDFVADELKHIHVSDVPELGLAFSYSPQLVVNDLRGGTGSGYPEKVTESSDYRSQRQKWIDDLAQCDGPDAVSFRDLAMGDLDLRPLAKNVHLKALVLSNTGFDNLSQLSEFVGLERLWLEGCYFDPKELERLAVRLPNLKKLVLDKNMIPELSLKDMPALVSVFGDNRPNSNSRWVSDGRIASQSLQFVNMPSLKEDLHLSRNLRSLHLENVPGVTGLSVQAAFPPNTILRGFRDLQTFTAGGPGMNDAVMDEVLRCPGLKKLTLAYADVSPAVLSRIGEMKSLEYLVLTGSQVTDEIFAGWNNLGSLKTLALDKTKISAASVARILSLTQLETLAIDGNLIGEEHYAQISELTRLKRLGIAGAQLSPALLTEIGKLSELTELDFSQCVLSFDTAKPLMEGSDLRGTLRTLKINNGKIDDRVLNNLFQNYHYLEFELIDCEVNPSLVNSLVRSQRAIVEEPDDDQMRMRFVMNSMQSPGTHALDEVPAKLFDPSRPSTSSDDLQMNQIQMSGTGTTITSNYSANFGPPRSFFEQVGYWIAESALSTQTSSASKEALTIE